MNNKWMNEWINEWMNEWITELINGSFINMITSETKTL